MALGPALLDLQELTERLRRECPWDQAQTLETIVPHTVEEAYEVADAVLAGASAKLVDELGDLLFQVYFLALLLEERGEGSLEHVVRAVHAKLVRRHPHVFGEARLATAGEVKERWETIKIEQEDRTGIFHEVPDSLPALLQARKVQRRAAATGFDWPRLDGPFAKLREEIDELEEAVGDGLPPAETAPDPRAFAEVGDVLFSVVNVARRLNVDPELALRASSARFVERVELAAADAEQDGRHWSDLQLGEQDRYYDGAKHRLDVGSANDPGRKPT